jgi:uncharacterized protein (TIRG00374 family)
VSKPVTGSIAPSDGKAARARLLGIARVLLAVGLLAFVATLLPWKDQLVHESGGSKLSVPGEIEGNWRSETIRFRLEPGTVPPEGWPEASLEALRSPQGLELSEGEYHWKPGMPRVFREMEPQGLVLGLALLFAAAFVSVARWWRLLRIAGCETSYWNTLRLTFLGFFFNLVVPGLTGGDVIKAVLVVRENPQRRADALMSVIVDRGLGLFVLVTMALSVVLFDSQRFGDLVLPVAAVFGIMCLAILLLMNARLRRALKLSQLLERLPQKERLRAMERALSIYARHPFEILIAFGLSALNHLGIAGAIFAIGRAFGEDQLAFPTYIAVTAIANVASTVPLTPSGIGVGEGVFGWLFGVLHASPTLGVAVSLTFRLLTVVLNLSGGIFLLLPGGSEVRAQMEDAQGSTEKSENPSAESPPR